MGVVDLGSKSELLLKPSMLREIAGTWAWSAQGQLPRAFARISSCIQEVLQMMQM